MTTLRDEERTEILAKAQAAKRVAPVVAKLNSAEKNAVLLAAADALESATADIIAANENDINAAKEVGMSDSLIDRLRLDADRITGIADGLRQVAALTDPVGEVLRGSVMPNGIQMRQVRVPLGVMGVVYEARPNVTIDAFGLALKSGNVALLRGSKSAVNTNTKLVEIVQQIAVAHDLPAEIVQLLPCGTHDSVQDLITARGLVDVVIPRGGAGLINAVVMGATVPTIETGTGNCHLYIDRDANVAEGIILLLNGKTRRCSVCNATETVLIDAALSDENKLAIITALQDAGVTVHGDVDTLVAFGATDIVPAGESDWAEEYLSMDIAAQVVDGIDGALTHIRQYSTGHTEGISTTNVVTAQRFADEVDSAAVMINASTAFTDGEQYGMGAEIGISTQKVHARGPMALPELTSTKWILQGTGQTRP
ncbi:MAG: glutamate-5-semialdehyde dehydrogenase [Corynebacterium sp.]|nr:glutamate-5-semialdehyde dehydrogenase [Corynebacterium sp.]